jgi:hypothetical protein
LLAGSGLAQNQWYRFNKELLSSVKVLNYCTLSALAKPKSGKLGRETTNAYEPKL